MESASVRCSINGAKPTWVGVEEEEEQEEEEEDAGVGGGVVVVVAEEGSLTCSSKARSARQMFRSSPVQFESTSAAVWERLVFLDPSN